MQEAPALRQAVGRSGFFTLALGAIVGSGWVVVLGDWLREAGPGGAVLGFLAGGLSMACIALCYGELAARFSRAGGEFLYTLETLGPFAGFLVGWFLTLFAISVCAFEGVVVGALTHSVMAGVRFGDLYTLAGSVVTTDALIIGIVGALGIAGLHLRGADFAIKFQNIVTYGFLCLMILLIALGLAFGDPGNLAPLLPAGQQSRLPGGIWVFSTCAFFLNGWQSALHALEERAPGIAVASAVRAMIAGILAGALLYCGLVMAAASALPWRQLIGDEMPARVAFASLTPMLGTAVLAAALISAAKTWSAIAWLGSRLLVAQARAGFLPHRLARVHPSSGAPHVAIAVVTLFTLFGPIVGRGAILPIVSMVSICLALSIILCLFVLLRVRARAGPKPAFTVPGGTPTIALALAMAIAMIGIAVLHPFLSQGKVPVEWYLLAGWGALGAAVYAAMRRSAHVPESAAGGRLPKENAP